MDGWLQTSSNDTFSIGYYEEADLPFFSALARNFTTLDNYFPSILSSTFPNRVFQHAAQTDRLSNTVDLSTLPTIWDTLAVAGVSHKYYYSNVPFLAFGVRSTWVLRRSLRTFWQTQRQEIFRRSRFLIPGSPSWMMAWATTIIPMLIYARAKHF